MENIPIQELFCNECGRAYFIFTNGVAHHEDTDALYGIDWDMDADHSPYSLDEDNPYRIDDREER